MQTFRKVGYHCSLMVFIAFVVLQFNGCKTISSPSPKFNVIAFYLKEKELSFTHTNKTQNQLIIDGLLWLGTK